MTAPINPCDHDECSAADIDASIELKMHCLICEYSTDEYSVALCKHIGVPGWMENGDDRAQPKHHAEPRESTLRA